MAEVRDMMGSAPVYLSFDIDALDPSYAPGTGNICTCCFHLLIISDHSFASPPSWPGGNAYAYRAADLGSIPARVMNLFPVGITPVT